MRRETGLKLGQGDDDDATPPPEELSEDSQPQSSQQGTRKVVVPFGSGVSPRLSRASSSSLYFPNDNFASTFPIVAILKLATREIYNCHFCDVLTNTDTADYVVCVKPSNLGGTNPSSACAEAKGEKGERV